MVFAAVVSSVDAADPAELMKTGFHTADTEQTQLYGVSEISGELSAEEYVYFTYNGETVTVNAEVDIVGLYYRYRRLKAYLFPAVRDLRHLTLPNTGRS